MYTVEIRPVDPRSTRRFTASLASTASEELSFRPDRVRTALPAPGGSSWLWRAGKRSPSAVRAGFLTPFDRSS